MLRRFATATLALALVLPASAAATDEAASFGDLIDEIGRTVLARSPETATDLGLSEELGLDESELDDLSYDYREETAALAQDALGRPSAVDPDSLTSDIVWPGQAPAYMVGMLEILRLRKEARAQLGADFDLAGFHDAVLRHGSVPLAALPMAVEAWSASVG